LTKSRRHSWSATILRMNNTWKKPTRVAITGRMRPPSASRDIKRITRTSARSLSTHNNQVAGRKVDLMKGTHMANLKKTVIDLRNESTSTINKPRIQIGGMLKTHGYLENPPVTPSRKRRISVINKNISQNMMIQLKPALSIITNLPKHNKNTKLEYVPKRNVVKRTNLKRSTIDLTGKNMVIDNEQIQETIGNWQEPQEKQHFVKIRKPPFTGRVSKRVRMRLHPQTLIEKAAQAADDSSSAYSYSSNNSEDEIHRSKKNLGPVIKSTTVARGGHIMLRNLPTEINARMLMMELFREDGDVINAVVHSDETGVQLGTGEVIFAKRKEAQNAIDRHCGSVWRGKKIKMTMIGQVIEKPVTTIMTRRERRNRTRKRKRGSLRPNNANTLISLPKNTVQAHHPLANEIEQDGFVEEPGWYSEEELPIGKPSQPQNQEEISSEDTITKVMDQNGLTLDARDIFPPQIEDQTPTSGPKRKQVEYIPPEVEDDTGFHVTLKNLKQYTYLSLLSDSDAEDT